ncbi:MAG TPA: META domain-containing protein [Porticoccaceae bacterium]|jgi:heat shock protein HslJ|nr:META domain-containing protein [Gammaproteobacteria bacterium]HIL60207.1 META domain-containing protein [Porticoccaceae bacterium]
MKANTLRNLLLTKLITISLLLVSAAQGAAEAPDLEGSNWQLVRLKVLGGFEFSPEEPSKYVLNFRSENRLTGASDCNQFVGSWIQEGSNLRFEPLGSTRKLCAPGSLHNNLVLYLRDSIEFSIVNGNMIVTTTTADIEIEFEAR